MNLSNEIDEIYTQQHPFPELFHSRKALVVGFQALLFPCLC